MSSIDELIARLCPNGVEYIHLKELFNTRNGYTPSKSKSEYWEGGTIPWFRMEDIRKNGRILDHSIQKVNKSGVKSGRLFPANSIIISTLATIGEHALVSVPFLANQQLTVLLIKDDYQNQYLPKFLFYYCFKLAQWCKNNTAKSSFASVDMSAFKRFKFPLVPIEIQQKIVDILDKFTKLESELESELELRRKQYEYYRDALLNFSELDSDLPAPPRTQFVNSLEVE